MGKKIRVIHVVLTMGNGGLENVVLNLCRNIDHPEIEQLVCCIEAEGNLVPFLKELGIPVFSMAKKPGISFLLPLKLAFLFRRQKIDVVHSHDVGANVYGGLGGLIARVKCLVKTEHGGINLVSKKILKFDAWLSNHLDKVIAVSRYLRERMVEQGIERQKIIVVPNGIQSEKYQQSAGIGQKRKEFGFSETDTIIYTVGRFVPLKNTRLLLKAAPKIIAEFPAVKFAIIGFGPLDEELKQIVVDLNLTEHVKFLGNRTDLPELLPIMDIFVLCSSLEGLGLVILEAMAAGKPVVATNVGGIPEIVKDNQNGLLFPANDAKGLLSALRKLLEKPGLSEELSLAGRKTVNERFGIKEMASTHTKIYRYYYYSCHRCDAYWQAILNNLRQVVKVSIFYFLYYSGVLRLFRRKSLPNLQVVAYHRVVEAEDLDYFPVGLAVTRQTFEKHLALFSKHFEIIDAAELLRHKEGLSSLPKNSLLITFDDGYQDNYTLAFDLLKKYRFPGIVFVTTSYIGGTKMFWSDIAAFILKAIKQGEYDIEKIVGLLSPRLIFLFSRLFQRKHSFQAKLYNDLMNFLKKQQDCEEILEKMLEDASLDKKEIQDKYKILSWEELRKMNNNNFICGVHTVSHLDLTGIPPSEVRQELVEAKKIVEEEIGQAADCFAYPYGFFNKETMEQVKLAGYKIAFSLSQGDNKSLFSIHRYNVWEDSFKGIKGEISPVLLKLALLTW